MLMVGCSLLAAAGLTEQRALAQNAPPTLGPAKQHEKKCDCTVFPWARECDKECGLVTGLVKSIEHGKLTISVPVLTPGKQGPAGEPVTAPIASFEDKTFAVKDDKLLAGLERGKRVALTFKREDSRTVVSSVRRVDATPANNP
jgi:hypothetical protein